MSNSTHSATLHKQKLEKNSDKKIRSNLHDFAVAMAMLKEAPLKGYEETELTLQHFQHSIFKNISYN